RLLLRAGGPLSGPAGNPAGLAGAGAGHRSGRRNLRPAAPAAAGGGALQSAGTAAASARRTLRSAITGWSPHLLACGADVALAAGTGGSLPGRLTPDPAPALEPACPSGPAGTGGRERSAAL